MLPSPASLARRTLLRYTLSVMKRLYVAAVVVGIVAVAGALATYTQRPVNIIGKALTNLSQAATADFLLQLTLENAEATQQVLGERGAIELTVDGKYAKATDTPSQLDGQVVLLTRSESLSVSVELDTRFLDDTVYVYIKKSPPTFSALNALKGQWIEFPRGGVGGEAPKPAASPNQFFTSVKRVGVQELKGEPVVVYQAVAQEAAVVQMMDAMANILGTRLTSDQIANLRDSVAKAGDVPVEFKIKRWTSELKQLSTRLNVPGGNQVQFTLTINDTNIPIQIEAPPDAVSATEALTRPPAPPQ